MPGRSGLPHDAIPSALYADRGLSIVGVNSREEDNLVRAYRKQYAVPYPIAMDRGGGFTRALETGIHRDAHELFPTTLFVTPAGFLYCVISGGMYREELHYRIEKFLAEAPPSSAVSPAPSPAT